MNGQNSWYRAAREHVRRRSIRRLLKLGLLSVCSLVSAFFIFPFWRSVNNFVSGSSNIEILAEKKVPKRRASEWKTRIERGMCWYFLVFVDSEKLFVKVLLKAKTRDSSLSVWQVIRMISRLVCMHSFVEITLNEHKNQMNYLTPDRIGKKSFANTQTRERK